MQRCSIPRTAFMLLVQPHELVKKSVGTKEGSIRQHLYPLQKKQPKQHQK